MKSVLKLLFVASLFSHANITFAQQAAPLGTETPSSIAQKALTDVRAHISRVEMDAEALLGSINGLEARLNQLIPTANGLNMTENDRVKLNQIIDGAKVAIKAGKKSASDCKLGASQLESTHIEMAVTRINMGKYRAAMPYLQEAEKRATFIEVENAKVAKLVNGDGGIKLSLSKIEATISKFSANGQPMMYPNPMDSIMGMPSGTSTYSAPLVDQLPENWADSPLQFNFAMESVTMPDGSIIPSELPAPAEIIDQDYPEDSNPAPTSPTDPTSTLPSTSGGTTGTSGTTTMPSTYGMIPPPVYP